LENPLQDQNQTWKFLEFALIASWTGKHTSGQSLKNATLNWVYLDELEDASMENNC